VQLVASGRDADVFADTAGRVLRRYRDSRRNAEAEAALMRYACERGLPVPAVYDAHGPDLVMERVEGVTMADALVRRPWQLARYALLLARVHDMVHRVAAPEWLERRVGDGDRLLHLDLHPENVLMASSGPVIIDWTNAAAGAADVDVLDTWLVMSSARVGGPRVRRTVATAGQRRFAALFLRATGLRGEGPALAQAAARRLDDPNMSEAERRRIARLASLPAPG
jgi:aminoglycoside phosphotransferase (APT) family kinase protein